MLVSDGISSILSDEEVVDLTRGTMDPKIAAERIISFSQDLGGDDNATAIVVPLAGWGKVTGPDKTKDLREYRWRQASERSCSYSFQFTDNCKQLGQRDNDVCNILIYARIIPRQICGEACPSPRGSDPAAHTSLPDALSIF